MYKRTKIIRNTRFAHKIYNHLNMFDVFYLCQFDFSKTVKETLRKDYPKSTKNIILNQIRAYDLV